MEVLEVIGIDIGKEMNEARIHSSQKVMSFENKAKGFKKLVNWVSKETAANKQNILFAFEHTGLYSFPLAQFLTEIKQPFVLIPGLEIKRSLGISRGKNDKIDAKRIARYAYEKRESIDPYELPQEEIILLKRLLSLRERLVKQRSGYMASIGEYKRFLKRENNVTLFEIQEKIIKELDIHICKVEKEMEKLIKSNDKLKKMYDMITSVKGAGKQIALYIIAYTNGFLLFKTWRKFASYCGVAPFPNSSGTSIRGRTKVSNLANKRIKTVLDLCAKSAIQYNMEMKLYYNKRVQQGKSKMGTINIIRNKLLARIFAVVQRGTPYVNTLGYAA